MRLIRLLKKDLAQEISSWVDRDLISADQAESICKLYGVDYRSIQSLSTGYNLLVSLGYLFVGLAVITLLGANWDDIPRGLRMTGLLALTVGTHGLALRSLVAGERSRATGLFLLGNLFYGASIILIAQIYHLGEHMPDGVFWWALGSLPFGVLLRDNWITLFSCLLATLWFWMEFSMGFFPTLFPVFIAAAIYVLVGSKPSTMLFISTAASIGFYIEALLSLLWSADRQRPEFVPEHLLVSAALFVFAYALSQWMHARESVKSKDYGALLSLWTLRFALIAMFTLTFEDPWRELIKIEWTHPLSMWLILGVLLGTSLWLGRKTGQIGTLIAISVFCGLSMLAVVLLNDTESATTMQVLYNIALVVAGIWLIVRGIHSGISHYFFLGIATILLIALVRYIDLIGDYIGGAILFIVIAAVLLGAAKFWKVNQTAQAREVRS